MTWEWNRPYISLNSNWCLSTMETPFKNFLESCWYSHEIHVVESWKTKRPWLKWNTLWIQFLVAQQLNTYFCVFVVCLSSVFDIKYLSLWISRIFKERGRLHIKSWEQTDNKQIHKCKKLKIHPTPTKVSYQLTKMTGS